MKPRITLSAAILLGAQAAGLAGLRGQTAVYLLDGGKASETDAAFTASASDQSAVYVLDGGQLALADPTIVKTGDASSVDNSSQYGVNAGILVASAGSVTISGGSITTAAAGANGLFATGTNSTIAMTGGTITTTGDSSHGVDVTYGGTIDLTDVTVSTAATSASAGLSTDYGGGTIKATGVTVTTAGSMSPAVYSTGTVTVNDSALTATGGQGGVIDGANSIALTNTSVTSALEGIKVHRTAAAAGSATVTVSGGSIDATGNAFYVTAEVSTGSTATITVENGAKVTTQGDLLDVDSGSSATLVLDGVDLTGNLVADSTSSITATLQDSATLGGSIDGAALAIDSTSEWAVSAASTLSSLKNSGTLCFASPSTEITVSGTATLGGKLLVDLPSSTPAAGTYTLLGAGKVSGSFDTVTLGTSLSSGYSASVSTTGTAVVLTVSSGTSSSTGSGSSTTSTSSNSGSASGSSSTSRGGGGAPSAWFLPALALLGGLKAFRRRMRVA